MQENLLRVDQVARYLKVDKYTVYRLVSQKKIPAFRVPDHCRNIQFSDQFNAMLLKEAKTQSGGLVEAPNLDYVIEADLIGRSGKRVSAYVDKPKSLTSSSSVVIIAPAYGETKENKIIIS